MTEVLRKLASRKLWITLFTLAAVLLGAGPADGIDPSKVSLIVVGALSGLYVLVQGLIDRAHAQRSAAISPEVQALLARLADLLQQALTRTTQPAADQSPETPAGSPPASTTAPLALLLLLAPLLLGLPACAEQRPACSPAALAALEASYIAEVTQACSGSTLDECEAAPAIEARHQVRLQEWVQCQ